LVKKKRFSKLRKVIKISFLALVLAISACYISIEKTASPFIYDDVSNIPFREVGLVLGTSKRLVNGAPNPYLYNRLYAARTLYLRGKVKYLLLSGDNHSKFYNEPMDMKKLLVKMGVPEEAIVLDYAGFRTLDSVVRCKKVFGQEQFTIISQPFHNKRAIYLARNFGAEAIAFNAKDVSLPIGFKVQAREILARVKAVIDLHITNAQPKFLGAQIQIAQK